MSTANYQKFINDKHKKLITPDHIIDQAVREATNSTIVTKKRIIIGENNEIYDIGLENKKYVIVRISHHQSWKPFLTEKWAIEQCKKVGVPVPNILLIKDIALPNKDIAVCIQEKLPGRTLDTIEGILSDIPKLRSYLQEAGKILGKIHSIKVEGFDGLDGNGKGVYATFDKWMMKRHEKEKQIKEAATNVGFESNHIAKALEIITNYKKYISEPESILLHNDFGPKHIFIDKDKISGVIDFEVCMGGDPVYDFAKWQFYFDNYPIEYLMEGYDNKKLFENKFELKLHFYKLHFALFILAYDYEQANPTGIEIAKKNILEDLGSFENL